LLTNYAAQYLNTDQGIALGDFNGDGKLDVAISDPYTASNGGISLGNGDGTLQTITQSGGLIAGAVPVQSIALQVAGAGLAVDLNGDGKADLMFGSTLLLSQAGVSVGATPTTTTLTVAPNPASAGQSVTLSATVKSASQVPTGTVEFFDGATALGSGSVSAQGAATFASTSLAVGTHALTAKYGGDSTFAASTSAAVSLTVNAATEDFAIVLSPASGSVAPGAAATTTVTLTPSGGFNGTATLACSGLPAGADCGFAPGSIAVTGGAGTSTLTISTMAMTAQNSAPPERTLRDLLPRSIFAVMLPPFIVRRRYRAQGRKGRVFAWVGLLAACAGLMYGCHGGGGSGASTMTGTPAGTFTVTITATSGSTSHAASYTLTVT
jgi:hypothetical protein